MNIVEWCVCREAGLKVIMRITDEPDSPARFYATLRGLMEDTGDGMCRSVTAPANTPDEALAKMTDRLRGKRLVKMGREEVTVVPNLDPWPHWNPEES